ncbi:MAG: DoxX family protein [Bdellovibrionales bacterium]|nr:DoxX family protein [Bdellovibrionales bacterium]
MNGELIGRILSGVTLLFLIVDSGMKIVRAKLSVEATVALGFPESSVALVGILLLVGIILHAIPKSSVIGAVLITGFLGGAVAAQFRLGNPIFTHMLFPVYVASFMWGGLLLRYPRLMDFLILT